jgi:riboflavin kinase/FMN adenylyltransferase
MTIRRLNDWRGLEAGDRGAAIALGNFDGVHRGHQRVIAAAADAARRLGAPLGVISFEPHPRRWFQPEAEPFRVMSVDQQARALEALGVEILYVLPFGAAMAGMTDQEFAREVLAEGLGVRAVAAGYDVSFGKNRTGDGDALRRYGERDGFEVAIVERVDDAKGMKLSSSAVREALKRAAPEEAAEILGRPFAIEGAVRPGDARGRTIGVPTLNVELDDYVRPAFGVYATRTRLPDGRVIDGVANLGRRPTVGGEVERLEVHLFDFDEDLYGRTVETQLLSFLRPEQKFAGLDALKAQIADDMREARRRLAG